MDFKIFKENLKKTLKDLGKTSSKVFDSLKEADKKIDDDMKKAIGNY
jgi:hypothetical protein